MHTKKLQVALLLVLGMLVSAAAFAQTSETGAIAGKVTQAGSPLPGVTVEIRSPELQGTKTDVTDTKGMFRFSVLPPGTYSLTATLSGYSPAKQNNIAVGLSRTVTLDITMSQAVSERITVTGAAPVVDITSSATSTNITTKTMASLPLGRNFVNVARVAPGTNADATGVTFYGSSGAENEYIIDGLNTTAARDGTQGKQVNIDFIQEVEVKTGGLPAEYGRMTGGTINAITKSGGNEYKGDVFGFDSAKNLRADNKRFGDYPGTTSSVGEIRQTTDYGGDLGGYFVKDRLWFFGAYDHADQKNSSTRINRALNLPNFSIPVGGQLFTTIKRELWAGKLTFRLTENQNLAISAFGDPAKTDGPLFAISGPPSTFQGKLKNGGTDFNGRYSGVFATSWVVNGEAGKHKESQTFGGLGTTIAQTIDNTQTPAVTDGGFGFFSNEKYDRSVGKLDINKYFASNDFKFGGDYEDLKATIDSFQGGAGQRIYKFATSGGVVYYRHRYNVNDKAPGFDAAIPSTWQIALPLEAKPETKNTSVYLQDSWRVLTNFTLGLGVRWESQQVIGRGGVTAFKIKDNWAPRLGFTWDVANNSRSKLYANYGRFYENIPMDINIRSFGGELTCFCYNLSSDPANLTPDPAAPRKSAVLGNGVEPVDPNLKGQHIEELLAGYEYEIAPNLAVGVKGTYRKLGDVIEDMLIGTTGGYLIANPGTGIGREAGFYEGGTVITPKAKRVYKGVEINANKRFTNNYQFYASYLWSRLEGNYDGTFQASTGQLDPNINSAFDYADFIVNNHGLLSNDRTHQLKFNGSYTFSGGVLNGLDVGLSTRYASGTPLTAVGYSFAYANWEYYLTPRGALGRGPADYEADIQVAYPIPIGQARLRLVADVFNVFNIQRKTALDQRFNRTQDPSCTGIPADICTSDGGLETIPGTITPKGTINIANAPNPDFLKAGTAFTQPRTIRFGARITF